MGTDEPNDQDAPGLRTNNTEDEDAEGHRQIAKSADPDLDARQASVHPAATADEDDTEGHRQIAKSADPDLDSRQPGVHI
jgi:hypothetical protein